MQRLVRIYTCLNVNFLEISCRGSYDNSCAETCRFPTITTVTVVKSTCHSHTPELCQICRPNHELNHRLHDRAINCSVTDGLCAQCHHKNLSQCMRFPTMWHFDKCRLGRASAASLLSLETPNGVQSND